MGSSYELPSPLLLDNIYALDGTCKHALVVINKVMIDDSHEGAKLAKSAKYFNATYGSIIIHCCNTSSTKSQRSVSSL
jgi:hypothetical protein